MISLVSVSLILLIAEITVRHSPGVTPGIYNLSFKNIDSLIILKGNDADSEGITKVGSDVKKAINGRIGSLTESSQPPFYDLNTEAPEIYSLIDNIHDLMCRRFSNDFSKKLDSIKQKPLAKITDLDSAFLYFTFHPINEDAFFSIPFRPYNGGKKKILLLGDSFTWGHSLSNKTSTFANILLAKGYTVYNTGIGGADVPQYLAIARKYIPILKPDLVIINFYEGNDIQYFPRPLKPYVPVIQKTNAGYLYMCPLGLYYNSYQEAFTMYKESVSIPHTTLFNRLCAKTALGTLLWAAMNNMGVVDSRNPKVEAYHRQAQKLELTVPPCISEVDSIQKIAKINGSDIVVSVIRNKAFKNSRFYHLDFSHFFDTVPCYVSDIKQEGYLAGDGHFSAAGHKEYAAFLDSVIKLRLN